MIEETKKSKERELDVKDLVRLIQDQSAQLEQLQRDRDMLFSIADKKRLSTYMNQHREHTPNEVRIREFEGKIVVGWKGTVDKVERVRPLRWLEDQRTMLMFEDKTTKEVLQVDFELQHVKIKCKRIGIVTDERTGEVAFKLVRLDNGQSYTIGSAYVN